MTSSLSCWWTKTKEPSLAPFVHPPAIVHYNIIICVSRDWLQNIYKLSLKCWLSPGQTSEQSRIQRSNFARSTVWPPMLDDIRPTFFVRSSVAWSLLLIKHCDQQFCSTQQRCNVVLLFQQSCVLNRVTFAQLADH